MCNTASQRRTWRVQWSKGTRGLPAGTEIDVPDQGTGEVSGYSDSLMTVARKNATCMTELSSVCLNCFGDCL